MYQIFIKIVINVFDLYDFLYFDLFLSGGLLLLLKIQRYNIYNIPGYDKIYRNTYIPEASKMVTWSLCLKEN